MIRISLCMIVKNEQAVLGRCLESVADVVDEIIVVDTGSSDDSRQIASQYGARLYDFPWCDDFSAARNAAFAKGEMDYLFWLDADDILEADQAHKLQQLKENLNPATDVVTMKYHVGYDAQGQPTLISTRGRLFRRAAGFRWQDPVHEYIPMAGKILHSDIFVSHKRQSGHGDRNLRIYESLRQQGKPFSPRATYYYARELVDHQRYAEASRYFQQFLDEGQGWIEDNIAACWSQANCYAQLGQPQQRMAALLRSFQYDLPRPEICCSIGADYLAAGDYRRAAYWYEQALIAPQPDHGGFVFTDYHNYIPHIQLAVCYYYLGQLDLGAYHNEQAALAKPGASTPINNRRFFPQQAASQQAARTKMK